MTLIDTVIAYNARKLVEGASVQLERAITNHLPRTYINKCAVRLVEARAIAHQMHYQMALMSDELPVYLPLVIEE